MLLLVPAFWCKLWKYLLCFYFMAFQGWLNAYTLRRFDQARGAAHFSIIHSHTNGEMSKGRANTRKLEHEYFIIEITQAAYGAAECHVSVTDRC